MTIYERIIEVIQITCVIAILSAVACGALFLVQHGPGKTVPTIVIDGKIVE